MQSHKCPRCHLGVRVNSWGRVIRCNHQPPFRWLLRPLALFLGFLAFIFSEDFRHE